MNRELDGIYFRIKRDGVYDAYCFSDMTEEEMKKVLIGQSEEWLMSLAISLGKTIKKIGDELDLVGEMDQK